METITTIAAVRERVHAWHRDGLRVAFVPTMGNLHPGHVSLIEAARRHGDRFVASIFVNPMQFGPNEDFAGVATIVAKLFHIVEPDVAVFGEKDFQQLTVIRRMVADLCIPVQVVGAPTVREADGLAMSSRNQYLTPEQRGIAPRIYEILTATAKRLQAGDSEFASMERTGCQMLEGAGLKPDYFAIRQADDLSTPRPGASHLVVLTAARLGKARLIDNIQVKR